ncbi:STAS domain-containing protein [Streptomyces sp. NPDC050095]|uniref:STAS domain-containing protein n=1 Tax=unclassified Streptomyces TaxID=2593676 RepID=UPI00343BC25D
MRQGNQHNYASGGFEEPDDVTGLVTIEDAVRAPVVRICGDCAVVELSGEIDLLAFQRMTPLLDAVAAGPYRVMAIDLTATTFFDCSGLSLVVRAHRRATGHDGRVVVVTRHRLTLRIIELAGLTDALSPVGTVAEALR